MPAVALRISSSGSVLLAVLAAAVAVGWAAPASAAPHRSVGLGRSAAAAGVPAAARGSHGGVPGRRSTGAPARRIRVVAAEAVWGDLAAQLGGRWARVISVVSDPNADPHDHASTPADARAVADADLVVVNGAGYDGWAERLLAAQPEPGRRVLDVAALLGFGDEANPHFWYGPSYVARVVDRITADYRSILPSRAAYFAGRLAAVEAAFAPCRARSARLSARFAGTRVAATESIVRYLARSLRLRLVTPAPFMRAVSEGIEPPAGDLATVYRQIQRRRFAVLLYNVQTATPLTTGIRDATRRRGIPVVGVSETIRPASASFERWMYRQLGELGRALGAARAARPQRGARPAAVPAR